MHRTLLLPFTAILLLTVDALNFMPFARCGPHSGIALTCKHSLFGRCCSSNGYCGSTIAHCGTGCQSSFGDCLSLPTRASTTVAIPTSVQVASTLTTIGSLLVTTGFSSASIISVPAPAMSSSISLMASMQPSPSPSGTSLLRISTDGTCGGSIGFSCLGSAYGNCCSEHGWCGSASVYCDTGCNAAFGDCISDSPSERPSSTHASSSTELTSINPTPTQEASDNGIGCQQESGRCGGDGVPSALPSVSSVPVPSKICGIEGFAEREAYYASSYYLLDATDVSPCAALCLAEPMCMSYIFNVDLQNCAYLGYTLSQGDFIATGGTNQLFWERSCAQDASL